jgi:hypothetical protein
MDVSLKGTTLYLEGGRPMFDEGSLTYTLMGLKALRDQYEDIISDKYLEGFERDSYVEDYNRVHALMDKYFSIADTLWPTHHIRGIIGMKVNEASKYL